MSNQTQFTISFLSKHTLPLLLEHPEVTELCIENCGEFQHLDFLQELPHLKSLKILNAPYLEDINGLFANPSLEKVHISNAPCIYGYAFEDLIPCPQIRELHLENLRRMNTLKGLSQFPNLKSLTLLHQPPYKSFKPLTHLSKLRSLHTDACLDERQILNLKGCKKLTDLHFESFPVLKENASLNWE